MYSNKSNWMFKKLPKYILKSYIALNDILQFSDVCTQTFIAQRLQQEQEKLQHSRMKINK